jgi:erythromycin esterase-like protein
MSRTVYLSVAAITVATLSQSSFGGVQAEDLRDYSVPFLTLDSAEFAFLEDDANNARIIGIGESTHGTGDFTDLARKMLAYLAAECGYNTLIIESMVGEVAYLNDYVLGKRDDLKQILTQINTSWRYRTSQFVELIDWIRAHNETHTDNPIEIHGMEMQFVHADAQRVREYLQLVGSQAMVPNIEQHLWQEVSRDQHLEWFTQLQAVFRAFESNQDSWSSLHGQDAYWTAHHHVEVMQQFLLTIAQTREQRKHDLRDIYMAENVEWIMWRRGQGSKALVWAHNSHIADGVDNGIVDVLGHQLRKRFGESYFSIAGVFGTGSYYAFPSNANEVGWKFELYNRSTIHAGTFTAELEKLGGPNVFVDFRAARADSEPLDCELNAPMTIMSGAGAQQYPTETRSYNLGAMFDAVMYLDETGPIEWMTHE